MTKIEFYGLYIIYQYKKEMPSVVIEIAVYLQGGY